MHTPESLVEQIALNDFLPDPVRRKVVEDRIMAVFLAQTGTDSGTQREKALECVKALWERYACGHLTDVYETYMRVESSLFPLEGNLDAVAYRDHFVHMFNTFAFGLRIISAVLRQTSDAEARRLFKVRQEYVKAHIPSFGTDYDYKERLFHLWVLIATFHDIAIPIEHLDKMGAGISTFFDQVRWSLVKPSASTQPFDAFLLHEYLVQISRIYNNGELRLESKGHGYQLSREPCYCLLQMLGRLFDSRNHGVVGGFLLWQLLEDVFLLDKSPKYQLSVAEFEAYKRLVSYHDNARAALAISLHSLKPLADGMTDKVLPIAFSRFPLTFLLMLSDELQEYLRCEGSSSGEVILVECQPDIEVRLADSGGICCSVTFVVDEHQWQTVSQRFDGVKKQLRRKLLFGADFELEIVVRSEKGDELLNERFGHEEAKSRSQCRGG